ncbi:MAG: hypothetical protein ACXWZB_03835 [Gaiellaceae bacterium]
MRARVLLYAAVVALAVAPVASAKMKIWLTLGDKTARSGQPFKVIIHTDRSVAYDLPLMAVAPGRSSFDVWARLSGDSTAPARIPRDGFRVPVTRIAPNRWRAVIRFPRSGRWRLLIPNGAPIGYMNQPPVEQTIVVRR